MAISSNFSEAAYKRSKALDKERKYKENVAKYGVANGGINYQTLSAPTLSGIIDGNSILIRQYGTAQNNPNEFIGVQTKMNVDDNGVLSPSDELPMLISIWKGKDYNKLPNNFTKSEDIAQAWCNMINGITENVPALDSLPFDIEGKYSKNKKDIIDNYINQDTNATIEEDEAAKKPEDTGSFDNMPHFKVRKKKAAKDNDIDNLILSDEDMKDFARNLADNINKSRTNKDTTKHILSSILRKY